MLWSLVLTQLAVAQPIGAYFPTIEAEIAAAEQVCVATISELKTRPDPDEERPVLLVTLEVVEPIKGENARRITDVPLTRTVLFDQRYEQWMEAGTRLLCFIQRDPQTGQPFLRSCLLAGPAPESQRDHRYHQLAPRFARDLTIHRTPRAVLKRARRYGRKPPPRPSAAPLTISIDVPPAICGPLQTGHWNTVSLPIDATLEKLGRRLVRQPETLLPDASDTEQRPYSRHLLQIAGVQCLRHFPSPRTRRLLHELLDQKPDASLANIKSVRHEALETLLRFNAELELPAFADQLTELDVSGAALSEATLTRIGRMSQLEQLNLRGSEVSPGGLRRLRSLDHLEMLEVSPESLADAHLRALKRSGQLHRLSIATAPGDERRPTSPGDVASVTLWNSGVTDAGLETLADFDQVVYLDLRGTTVGDAGLPRLAHMKGLRYLHLDHSRVTDRGIDQIGQFPKLEVLGLSGASLTDASIGSLAKLTQLRYLRIADTRISEEGRRRLREALPNCKLIGTTGS